MARWTVTDPLRDVSIASAQRARQAQVVQRVRSQAVRDRTHLLERPAHRFARLAQACRIAGPTGGGVELEHHRRERLAHLVVQLARHPASLPLGGRERPARAVAPLALEATHHDVERRCELADLRVGAIDGDPPAGTQEIDVTHEARQTTQRRQRATHDDAVQRQHREQADDDRSLRGGHGKAHRQRRQHQREGGKREDRRIGHEDASEQAHRHDRRPAPVCGRCRRPVRRFRRREPRR